MLNHSSILRQLAYHRDSRVDTLMPLWHFYYAHVPWDAIELTDVVPLLGITWALIGMFFMAGAILLIFLTLLGGATNANPLNMIWFVQARTGNIPGAPAVSRWTFWNVCSVDGDGKSHCGSSHPDFPIDPPSHRNFDTTVNVPKEFVGTRHYFLTSRFVFPFLIISLFFCVCSFFLGVVSMFSRVGSYVSAVSAWVAIVFQILSASLMTAVSVQARNKFNKNGQIARVGSKAFGFMWTALACIFLSCLAYCFGGGISSSEDYYGYTSGREGKRRGYFRNRHEDGDTSDGVDGTANGKTNGSRAKISYA